MSIEPTDTTPTAGPDDRSGDVPAGGFAPIVDMPEAGTVATMPPPPGTTGAWTATAVDSDAVADPPEESSGHFPHTSFSPPPPPAAPVDDLADDVAEVEQQSDDGVVFFGDQPDPTPPSGWVSDGDSDLILPIEPARLVSASPAGAVEVAVTEPEFMVEGNLADGADDFDGAEAPVADVRAVVDLAHARLRRALSSVVARGQTFFEDDATEIVVGPITGPIVLFSGSELVGVLAGEDPSEPFGTSLELGVPDHVPLGIRFPLELVTAGDAGSVTEVGRVVITAVSGALEVTAQSADRIAGEVAGALTRDLGRAFDEIDRRREEHGVTIGKLTLDSGGAIRIEVERS